MSVCLPLYFYSLSAALLNVCKSADTVWDAHISFYASELTVTRETHPSTVAHSLGICKTH